MKHVKITADVHSADDNAGYRIYIDDTMMVERSFVWCPWRTYVEEHMIIEVEEGSTHTIRVETLRLGRAVTLSNITVEGEPSDETFTVAGQ